MSRHQQVIRQWKLLRLLERAPDGLRLADAVADLGARLRTLYRDIEALQAAGFPLYSDNSGGGTRWRLTDNWRAGRATVVPLAPSEILALRGARCALESIGPTPFAEGLTELTARLDTLLTPAMRSFAQRLDRAFVGDRFGRPDYRDLEPISSPLNRAIAEHLSVDIRYRAPDGGETHRRVDPYNLWTHRGILYLVAYCHLRRDLRTFALARLFDVQLTGEHFTPQPDYSFEAYASRRFRIMSEGQIEHVRIRFAPEAAGYVQERCWHPSQSITPCPNGSGAIELTMEVDGLIEVASWILSFGPRARALAPPSLVERVRAALQQALAGYSSHDPITSETSLEFSAPNLIRKEERANDGLVQRPPLEEPPDASDERG